MCSPSRSATCLSGFACDGMSAIPVQCFLEQITGIGSTKKSSAAENVTRINIKLMLLIKVLSFRYWRDYSTKVGFWSILLRQVFLIHSWLCHDFPDKMS